MLDLSSLSDHRQTTNLIHSQQNFYLAMSTLLYPMAYDIWYLEYGSVVLSSRTKCDVTQINVFSIVFWKWFFYHEPRNCRSVIMALKLSTLSERREINDIKLLNGLISGLVDSLCLLSRIDLRILGITRSRDPYYLVLATRNYLKDQPLRRAISYVNNQSWWLSHLGFLFCCIYSLFFLSSRLSKIVIKSLILVILYIFIYKIFTVANIFICKYVTFIICTILLKAIRV